MNLRAHMTDIAEQTDGIPDFLIASFSLLSSGVAKSQGQAVTGNRYIVYEVGRSNGVEELCPLRSDV